MFRIAHKLRERGVIGLNARNAGYIGEQNPRRLYRLVDDKVETKRLAIEAGITVPQLYELVESQFQIRYLREKLAEHPRFVIKPAKGSQGDGIIVIDKPIVGGWRKSGGGRLTWDDIAFHLSNILSGMYSLGGQPDCVIIEERVEFDPLFEKVTFHGVPDIRVVVYRGVPAMGMVRLPTRESDGKANLHKGGVGVGVDLASGRTTFAMQHGAPIDEHPDTGEPISGIEIPGWTHLLKLAALSFEMTGLGYVGVDLVLDRNKGPMLLELNARPGLAIQVANRVGLRGRLDKIDAARESLGDLDARVAFSQTTFRAELDALPNGTRQ